MISPCPEAPAGQLGPPLTPASESLLVSRIRWGPNLGVKRTDPLQDALGSGRLEDTP